MTVRIGAEEEFHVVDVESGRLVPGAAPLLERLGGAGFTRELHRSVVERNSQVHDTLDGLYDDLCAARRRLDSAAAPFGLAPVAAGTPPLARVTSRDITPEPRYRRMADDYRRVADEQLICSAQIHVDVPDRDTAVRAMCPLSPWLPPLLALSASSPFWLGSDTGYASWRTMLWQRWPTAGPAGCYRSAAEYDAAVDELIGSGVITDTGMLYQDVRPSAHQRTLELRICDACPRAGTVVLVAGLFRALVRDARDRLERGRAPRCDGHHEWLRAAAWRAARSGLEGELVDPLTRRPAPAPVVLRGMLRRLRPALEASGDHDTVRALLEEALRTGSAAHRLRRVARDEDLLAGVGMMAAETRGGRPPPRAPAHRRRRPTAPPDAARTRAGIPSRTAPGTAG
ncbi:carboxylate-amine ligase [Streptomyces capillispiralis]|uniref:Putative glutamate--cysteine ligase 2 n=1 Tax=Streptomyces capillispiralis TaxID=68182 RepID=A0A561T865_9ACTN|nr:glutamate--cysteine ligase [Streptomyces capillispiralis]TWF83293.1 carboxylate-amine ligase [Streptomyces capillispiralis]GHH94242.1 putative glutamate--cysteine ligase 2-2 [Streptomyces capillispiralis]